MSPSVPDPASACPPQPPTTDDNATTGFDQTSTSPMPQHVGRYPIMGAIGRGGMGTVWRGHDDTLNRDLAVKVLCDDHAGQPEIVERFVEEAQIGGQLQHPGVVPVYELGREGERPYFTMKLVEGRTLASLLAERAFPADDFPRILLIFEQIAQALGYAHAHGVIHRDLKPANIMVGEFGEVQVMDWGLAKRMAKEQGGVRTLLTDGGQIPSGSPGNLTTAGSVLGTPAYMAPEQARGETEALDERCDVFGLGAILCEVLTGKPPFSGFSAAQIIAKAARAELAPAFARLEECGAEAELTGLARSCLAAEREQRPQDAGVVAQSVAAHRAAVQERLRQTELARAAAQAKAQEARKRQRLTVALATMGVLLIAAVLGGAAWLRQKDLEVEFARRDKERELASEHQRQREQATQTAQGDLSKFTALSKEGRWAEALAVAERGLARLSPDTPAQLGEQLRRARADMEMVQRLEQARLLSADSPAATFFDVTASDRAFLAAFKQYGLDVFALSADEVAHRVASSAIRRPLLDGLDRWLAIKDDCTHVLKGGEPAVQARQHLAAILLLLDGGDPWHKHFREALVPGDWATVQKLAPSAPLEELGTEAVGLLARGYSLQKDWKGKTEFLKRAQRRRPDDFWCSYDLGVSLLFTFPPQADEAARYLTAALSLRPGNLAARAALASALFYLPQHTAEAESLLRDVLHERPDYGPALCSLGAVLLKRGRETEALAAYRQAGQFAAAQVGIGDILFRRKDLKGAEAAYREAFRLRPKHAPAYGRLGTCRMRQNDYAGAVDAFHKAIALDPSDASYHNDLGAVLLKQSKPAEAAAAFRAAVQLAPIYAGFHNNLGNALAKQGQLTDAVAAYREALHLRPNYANAWANLGDALRRLGHLREAAAACRMSVWLNPDDATGYLNLANALAEQRELGEALHAFREAIRRDAKNALAWCNLGQTLRLTGQLRESRDAYRRGNELGQSQAGWKQPSAKWLRQAEHFVELEKRLPDYLSGKAKAASPLERAELARLCAWKKLPQTVRFYRELFASLPRPLAGLRSEAARAFLEAASCANALSDAERADLRQEARAWLEADLQELERLGTSPHANQLDRVIALKGLFLWQEVASFAVVRDEDGLSRLSPVEREAWTHFWNKVAALRQKLEAPPKQ
jgi:tetratricopeptide (TPR) repeat protein